MNVVEICATMPGFEHGLNSVMNTVKTTLEELGVTVEEINIAALDIHYFDGIKAQVVENIFNKINAADGVILAMSASVLAPCALMQTFLEHFNFSVYKNCIKDKRCFIIAASIDGSERSAVDYVSKLISDLGGIDAQKMAVGKKYLGGINEKYKEVVEKYTEDFYRLLRQDREFFVNASGFLGAENNDFQAEVSRLEKSVNEILPKKKIKAEDLLQQVNFDSFNEVQEQDINEITKMLSSQYSKSINRQSSVSNLYKDNVKFNSGNVVPHLKTCKQKTQSLVHYFQPQLAGDMNAVIQLNVKGNEKFECYLQIKDGSCDYFDGVHENPDVTVFSDDAVWNDILNGKYSTQKAFMIGQLKVRGNFVILTKFDQLFKIQQ